MFSRYYGNFYGFRSFQIDFEVGEQFEEQIDQFKLLESINHMHIGRYTNGYGYLEAWFQNRHIQGIDR